MALGFTDSSAGCQASSVNSMASRWRSCGWVVHGELGPSMGVGV